MLEQTSPESAWKPTRATPNASTAREHETTVEIEAAGTPIRFMLVDNDLEDHNRVIAEVVSGGLSNYVEYMSTGCDAIRHLRRAGTQLPDILLLEMYLPDIRGRDVLRWVRRRFPDIDVIALTHYASESFVRRVYEEGVSCFMRKPFTLQGLLLALGTMTPGKYGLTVTRTPVDVPCCPP